MNKKQMERWKMLEKEEIWFDEHEPSRQITKEDEIEGLKGIIKAIQEDQNLTDEEAQKEFEEGLKEIEEKYNAQ